MVGGRQMNGPVPTVLIDQRWFDHECLTCLYHPSCADRIAKHYRMPKPDLRYRPYTGVLLDSQTCDFCHKALLWSLAEHMTPKEA